MYLPRTMAKELTSPNNNSSEFSVTAVIITLNEETMIVNCIECLRWADEIIVLDTGSTDRTRSLAQRAGARVETAEGTTFAQWRNEAVSFVNTAWILYVDADERVTPALAKTIQSRVRRTEFDAYTLQRNNIHFGKWLQHGGWNTDSLLRLVQKNKLRAWVGEVHEHAEVIGRVGHIEEPLVHLTHRNLYDGLEKSIHWTDIEARLLLAANHPLITPLRLVKIVTFDLLKRFLIKKAGQDGPEGSIEAMIQAMNRFLVYVRLWELQQKPPLEKRYERIEGEIQKQWEKS